jgi:hypothetical protein
MERVLGTVFTNNLTLPNTPSIARPRRSSPSPNGADRLLATVKKYPRTAPGSTGSTGGAGPVVPTMRKNQTGTITRILWIPSRSAGSGIAATHPGELPAAIDSGFEFPQSGPELDPILLNIPLQLLAYHVALKRGCDIDKPRNLAKSVTSSSQRQLGKQGPQCHSPGGSCHWPRCQPRLQPWATSSTTGAKPSDAGIAFFGVGAACNDKAAKPTNAAATNRIPASVRTRAETVPNNG